MKLVFVSDLHIQSPQDPCYGAILGLMENSLQPEDILVLGGDIFDLFVGNRTALVEKYHRFFDALRVSAAKGTSVHYIEGNHDFDLAKTLASIPNARAHENDLVIEIANKRFYLSHGDQIDQADWGYRAFRFVTRTHAARALLSAMPDAAFEAIAKSASVWSDLKQGSKDRIKEVFRAFASQKIAEGFDFVILGHTHIQDELRFGQGQYMNIGYPPRDATFIMWNKGEPHLARQPLMNRR